jgi:hypothetical protein
MEGFKYQ